MAESIGVVTIVHGRAEAVSAEGTRTLSRGDDVYQGEKIHTGPESALEITLADETVLSQGEDSTMVLDTYVYDPETSQGEAVISLMKGTFRSVTGKIVDSNPDAYSLQSPLAEIGIRGTTTGHTVPGEAHPDRPEDHMVIEFDGKPVVVQSSQMPGMPAQIIGASGLKAQIGIDGHSMLMAMTAADLTYFSALSSDSLQQSAPDFTTDPLHEDAEEQDPDDTPDEKSQDDAETSANEADAAEGENGEEAPAQETAVEDSGEVVTLAPVDDGGDQSGTGDAGGGDPTGDPVEDGDDSDDGADTQPPPEPEPEPEKDPEPSDDPPEDDPVVTEWEDWFNLGRDADGRGLDFTTLPEQGTVQYGKDGAQDSLIGVSGNNVLVGLGGDDELVGSETGKNLMFGGAGNDKITMGSSDHNLVYAGSGDDTVINNGGVKGSIIWGGSGNDRFEYRGLDTGGNLWESDEIGDFHSYAGGTEERDQILFDGSAFKGHNVSSGEGDLTNHLDPSKFDSLAIGEYDPETGEGVTQNGYNYYIYMQDDDGSWSLFYDDNGTLAGGNVKRIATFEEDVELQAEDLAML